jgi:replicative DNA helicase
MDETWSLDIPVPEEPAPFLPQPGAARHPGTFEDLYETELTRERARRAVRKQLDDDDRLEQAAALLDMTCAVNGADFIFGPEADLEPIWGTAEQTAWAAGEAMMLFGPQGTGKTTIAQQLMAGRLGLRSEVLGMPVTPSVSRVLYIAGDRPRQAARAMRRLFRNLDEANRRLLEERLIIWKGPLPHNLTERPTLLKEMAEAVGADTVFVDSIKDVVSNLNDHEAGSLYNKAIQLCLVAGVQVCDLHHPRKADTANGNKPKGVDDVYGSTWLTAGHGSIMSIWGKTGDLVVELSQLKMVNDEVGPFKVEHDHEAGVSHVQDRFDLLGYLAAKGSATVREVAAVQFETQSPSPGDVAKARRALGALVRSGEAKRVPGSKGGANGGHPDVWEPTATGVRAAGDGPRGRTTLANPHPDALVSVGGFGGGGRSVVRPPIFDDI